MTSQIRTTTTDWTLTNNEGETIASGEWETPINLNDEFFDFDAATEEIGKLAGMELVNNQAYTESGADERGDWAMWTVSLGHTLTITEDEIILDGKVIAAASEWDDSLMDVAAAEKVTGLDIVGESFEMRWDRQCVAHVATFLTD